jgi:hypothetical protein
MQPEIEFVLNSHGITLFSNYFVNPRYILFEQKGRCPTCKSDNVEVDYAIHNSGVVIFCSRIKKEVFIQFVKMPMVPKVEAIVRFRARSKTYNIPLFDVQKKTIGKQVNDLIMQTLSDEPMLQQTTLDKKPIIEENVI